MAGGKQKRAAKVKQWKESQHLLQRNKEQQEERRKSVLFAGSGSSDGNGSGDGLNENDLHRIKLEILRQRQKKKREKPNGLDKFTNMLDRFLKLFDHWPSWATTVLLSFLITFGIFFVVRIFRL